MFGEYRFFQRRARTARGASATICAALTLFAACYSPNLSLTDCTIPCLKDCPSGSVCRNNFCVHTDSTATCSESDAGGAAGSTVSMSGAAGSVVSMSGADAGVGGVSGASAGSAGSAGATAGTGGAGGAAPFDVQASATTTLCPGQGFTVQLSATGGVAPYTWALPDGSAASTVLSATTGAAVQVSGIASKPQPSLQISTHDESGAAVTTNIPLTVGAVGPGECPQITPNQLPDPCQDNQYYTNAITVTGGTAPFVWTALSVPAGLSFDANLQTVSGTALPAGASTPLTLQVTDNTGHQTQMTYPLAYRDKCWLGFMSAAAANPKAHLFDPALGNLSPALESSANNAGVVDFKFSPDGKFLVYRRAEAAGGTQDLVLAIAPNWQEQVLDVGGSVLEYAWSHSASVLAVAFQNDTGTMLGGINVANAAAAPASGGGITGTQTLQPVQMIDPASAPLSSDLLWFQDDAYLAFHADGLPGADTGFESPYYAHLDSGGFSAVSQLSTGPYFGPITLLPALNGVFAFYAGPPPALDFNGSAAGLDFDTYLGPGRVSAVADPAGLYVALPTQSKLQLLLTSESGGSQDPPATWTTTTDACSSILAWDPHAERIACDADVAATDGGTATGEVRLFSFTGGPTTPQVVMTPMKALAGYQQGEVSGHRRSFSAGGNWLAFSTESALIVGDVREAPQVQQQVPLPAGSLPTDPSALAFSPDETLLLWQISGRLGVIALQKNGVPSFYGDIGSLQGSTVCNEEFTDGPGTWCGGLTNPGAPVWSADSRFAATFTTTQGVRVYDLESYISSGSVVHIDACDAGCSGDFTFQP